MKNNIMKRISVCSAVLLMLIGCLAVPVFAEASGQSAVVHGLYKHPATGEIQDSGGESSEALGQSMVNSMVGPQGYWEEDENNNAYLSIRLNLMSNVSKVDFSVQEAGKSDWKTASWKSTAKGEDSEDFRISMPAKDSVIQAKCFVDAMGRDVVFFITADQFTPGNQGGFLELKTDKETANGEKGTSVIPQNTVGLVTGGKNDPQPQQDEHNSNLENQMSVQEVELSASVWVMFFVLVFCAQLLACFAFWGIKILIERKTDKQVKTSTLPEINDPDEDDFDMEALSSDWEEEV